MTAPGNSAAIPTSGFTHATFAVTIASINTSATIRFRGVLKKMGWGSLDADNDSLVVTANGTYYRTYVFAAGVDSIRISFHSEAGGTAAFFTTKTQIWNQNKL